MKRCIRIIFLSLITLSLFIACDKIEYDMPSGTSGTLLKVDFKMDTTLVFSCEAITSSLVFESNFSWVAEVEEQATSWLTISQTQGKPGTHEIHFSITKNDGQDIRYGRITLYAGDASVVVTIKQKAEDFILEGDEEGTIKIYLDSRKQDTSYSFYANVEWTASIDEETYEWIKLDMSGVKGQVKLIIKVEENLQSTDRTGTIIVQSDNNKSFVIQVIQENKDEFKYEDETTLSYRCVQSQDTFSFKARVNWTATVAEADKEWLSVDQESGTAGDIDLKITAQDNSDPTNSRTGQITIAGKDSTFILTVNQDRFSAFEYTQSTDFTFPRSGGTQTFEFISNVDEWTISGVATAGIFSVSPNSGGKGRYIVTITCFGEGPNGSPNAQSRSFSLKGGEKTVTLKVTRK